MHRLRSSASWDATPAPVTTTPRAKPDLDWHPEVGIGARAKAFLLTTAAIGPLAYFTRPWSTAFPGVLWVLAAFLVTYRVASAVLLESQYAARMLLERELADPDSRFRSVLGVDVHYKVKDGVPTLRQPGTPALAVHCYHGFGASSFSYNFVQQLLASRLGALVTAHDMPGFGLTQRPPARDGYLLSFNARLAHALQTAELAARSLLGTTQLQAIMRHVATPATDPAPPANPNVKRIVMGHSLGGACATIHALRFPQEIAAIILINPAIIASAGGRYRNVRLTPTDPLEGPSVPGCRTYTPTGSTAATTAEGSSGGLPVGAFMGAALLTLKALLLWTVATVLRLAQPLLLLLLRGMVRSRQFWANGLGAAWHDRNKLTGQIIDGYRQAMLVRGFDKGFLSFLYSRLCPHGNLWDAIRHARSAEANEDADLPQRLARLIQQYQIPVLVVHGQQDKLVPQSNSEALVRVLGAGSRLVVMEGCGHIPHEEHPELFVEVVRGFVEGVAGLGVPAGAEGA